MGWNPFKSEQVTQVATSVSRLIDDKSLPSAMQTGVIKGLINDGDVADYAMEELVASIGIRAERMYRYAETNYAHGLPSGEIYSSTQGRTQVENIIELIEGVQVSMEYSHYGTANALHIGWIKLLANHGYIASTNVLGAMTSAKGKTVYLKDMVVVVPASQLPTVDPGRVAQWGTAACAGVTPERPSSVGSLVGLVLPTDIHSEAAATSVYLRVTGVWQDGTTIHEETFTIDLSGYDLTANYFHAKYLVNGQTKYWMYKLGTGTYSLLEQVFVAAPAVSGSYFPFTYFRFNKASQLIDKTSAAYKTSKKMLSIIGMDYDLIAAGIDENPDIGNIEQAMLTFAVPSVSTNAIESRYLFDYFDNVHAAMDGTISAAQAQVLRTQNGYYGYSDLVESAVTTVIQDKRFKMTLGNNGIYKRVVAGSIGAVGTYTSSYETTQIEQTIVESESGTSGSILTPIKVHKYRHQIAVGLYEEVLVRGLRMTYNIYGGYNTVGDETDDILMIPIDRAVAELYSIAERELLYARSMHFIFNSRVVTEVKWYQQSWFSTFLIIVAVVVTIVTYGADGGSTIAAALGLSGTAGLIATIIVQLAIGQLLPAVFRLFVKVLGQNIAEILAIIAIVYGAYKLYQAGGSLAGAPWSAQLLQLSTGLQQAVLKEKFADLLEEKDQLSLFIEEQTKLLDKAEELLANRSLLNPIVIFGEKAEDFYNRTVHFGNIGVLGINAISSYVDMALTLPKLKDTLGEDLWQPSA